MRHFVIFSEEEIKQLTNDEEVYDEVTNTAYVSEKCYEQRLQSKDDERFMGGLYL